MLAILHDFLNDATTPEMTEAIRQAHDLFDQFHLPNYEQGFEELVMMDGQAESGTTLESIVDLTRALSFQILEEHHLEIAEDAMQSELNVFLSALLLLPAYDAPETLLAIYNQEEQPEELVAEMVALVSGKDVHRLAHLVTHVSGKLLQSIAESADRKHGVVLSHDQQVIKQQRITLYNNFVMFAKIQNLKLAFLLAHGLDVGHPYQVYLNLIGQDFDEMEPLAIACEMICMAFISSDAWSNPRIPITESIDQYIADMDKITKVDIMVSDLLLRFNAYAKV